jgi:hypothetical protein
MKSTPRPTKINISLFQYPGEQSLEPLIEITFPKSKPFQLYEKIHEFNTLFENDLLTKIGDESQFLDILENRRLFRVHFLVEK